METPDTRAEAISRVTAEQVQRVAQRIAAGADEVRLAFVGPEDQGADLLEAATA
jgi:predicted Zn-dependent peptidase